MNLPPIPPDVRVRRAVAQDGDSILSLVEGLARYEKLTPPDQPARQRLLRDMFWERPRIEAYLGEYGGKSVGYAFAFESYSSFLALPTLFLEDIFVLPEYRKHKVGLALFLTLAGEALRRGCGRMEWAVLDWNQLAMEFYERLGASRLKEWHLFRLSREQLSELAGSGI